jgi:hypothetical protein
MTRHTPLWLQAGNYAASEDRWLLGALWPGPGCTGGVVTFQSGMSVTVAPCTIAVPSQNGTGTTLCHSDAYENPPALAGAPGVGLNRYDLIICQPRGNDLDGGANNDLTFTNVTGVAAASPVVPAVPAGAVGLAQIYVPGQTVAITPGNIVDIRPAMLNPAVEPAGSSGPLVARQDMLGDWWVCKQGVNGGAWRRARDVLRCRYARTTAWNLPTGAASPLGYNAMIKDDYGLYSPGTGVFTAPITGWWRVTQQVLATPTAANQWIQALIISTGAVVAAGFASSAAGSMPGLAARAEEVAYLAAGVTRTTSSLGSAAIAGYADSGWSFMVAEYLGSG